MRQPLLSVNQLKLTIKNRKICNNFNYIKIYRQNMFWNYVFCK